MKLSDKKSPISFSRHLENAQKFESAENSTDSQKEAFRLWEELQHDNTPSDQHMNSYYRVYHQIHQQKEIRQKQLSKSILRYAAVAAILIIAVFAGSQLFIQKLNFTNEQAILIESPEGVHTRFFLPDGSNGWLNSSSKLSFKMNKTMRQAELSGEAFFEVKKQNQLPFEVHTPHYNVRVLGTRFNVYSYEGEKISEVVLESGSVNITSKTGLKEQIIKPGQSYTYLVDKNKAKLSTTDVAGALAWINGSIRFKNEPLREIIPRIERFYHIDLDVNQPELLDYPFYGEFTNEPLESLLDLMKLTIPMEYKIEKRKPTEDGKFEKRKVVLHLKQ